jgi:hypothetical protein
MTPETLQAEKMKIKNTKITPQLLTDLGACREGKDWAVSVIGKGMDLVTMLPLFERADWMLWLLKNTEALDKVGYVRLAVVCAQSVLDIYEKKYPDDKRPRLAIDAAIRYAREPTEKNREAAAYADAAYAAAYAAAAYAAYAAAYAAAAYAAARLRRRRLRRRLRAPPPTAAAASADAAYADAAARKEHHKKMCALMLKEMGL